MTPLRIALLQHDMLDPEDAQELRERLTAQPPSPRPLRTAPRRSRRWRLPPPAMGLQATASHPAVFGSTSDAEVQEGHAPLSVSKGERFCMSIRDLPDAARRVVVVLRRCGAGDWEVRSPQREGRLTRLDQFERTEDGFRTIQLLASGPAGLQRWALALVPEPLDVDWSVPPDQRWAALQEAILRGQVPVASTDLRVIHSSQR